MNWHLFVISCVRTVTHPTFQLAHGKNCCSLREPFASTWKAPCALATARYYIFGLIFTAYANIALLIWIWWVRSQKTHFVQKIYLLDKSFLIKTCGTRHVCTTKRTRWPRNRVAFLLLFRRFVLTWSRCRWRPERAHVWIVFAPRDWHLRRGARARVLPYFINRRRCSKYPWY